MCETVQTVHGYAPSLNLRILRRHRSGLTCRELPDGPLRRSRSETGRLI